MAQSNVTNSNLLYFDGFEDYNTSQISRYFSINKSVGISAGSGRSSGSALSCGNGGYVSAYIGAQTTVTVGFAIKYASGNNCAIFELYDIGSTAQCRLIIGGDNILYLQRGGTTIGTGIQLSQGIWYYIEWSLTVNSTTGSSIVKVNGQTVINLSSTNTQNTSNANVANYYLGMPSYQPGNLTAYYDDFYIRNDSTFLGDCRVESKLPSANGSTIQWTPLSGSNYSNVSDNPSDDNTTYNYTSTTGNIDLFSYPALTTTSGTIYAVMLCPVCEVDTAGLGEIQPVYNISSTNYLGISNYLSAQSYNAFCDIQGKNPATSAAWLVSDITSTQFGIKRIA